VKDNTLTVPIIHPNGTPKRSLLAALDNVHRAINDAMDALRQAGPNQRDYSSDASRWELALEQHRIRGEALKFVLESVQAEIDAITDL